MSVNFIVYSKTDCCLCEEMLEQLRSLINNRDCIIRTVKIDGEPELQHAFGARIPVLVGDGAELCEGKLDAPLVEEYINRRLPHKKE